MVDFEIIQAISAPGFLLLNITADKETAKHELRISKEGEIQSLLASSSARSSTLKNSIVHLFLFFEVPSTGSKKATISLDGVSKKVTFEEVNRCIWHLFVTDCFSKTSIFEKNFGEFLHTIQQVLEQPSEHFKNRFSFMRKFTLVELFKSDQEHLAEAYCLLYTSKGTKLQTLKLNSRSQHVRRLLCLENCKEWYVFVTSAHCAPSAISVKQSTVAFHYAFDLMIKRIARLSSGRKVVCRSHKMKQWIKVLTNPGYQSELISNFESSFNTHNYSPYNHFIAKLEPKVHKILLERLEDEFGENEPPLITVISPVYNTPLPFFEKLYRSLQAQTHQHWEWIIVDDFSSETESLSFIETHVTKDPRVKLIKSTENQHISKTSNIGIKQAKGDIVCFVDHDDEIAAIALSALAYAHFKCPDAKWFYSDEDFISEKGVRHSPHLKPAFNPELLKSHNYITHLSAIRKNTLDEIGLLDSNCDGAQDYDLHLRLANLLTPSEIVHIPLILYHWRQAQGSTALRASFKSYTHEAGKTALNKLFSTQFSATTLHSHPSEINFFIPQPERRSEVTTSIIIPFRDQAGLLKTCIDGIHLTCEKNKYELILVDNGSKEQETLEYLKFLAAKDSVTVLSENGKFNFSRLINIGALAAKGEVLLFLNNDIEAVKHGWLEELRDHALIDTNGCVGCKLLYPDGTIQHAGVALGLGGYAAHYYRGAPSNHVGHAGRLQTRYNVAGVTGAALAVRKSVFEEVGGFDEAFEVAYNDVDFCLKVHKAGYWNICSSHVELIHHESKSRGHDTSPEKKKRFEKEKALLAEKWPDFIQDDPFLNPFVTRGNEYCGFAHPSEIRLDKSFVFCRRLSSHVKHSLLKKDA